MLKFGTIAEVDGGRAKVLLPEYGVTTDWLSLPTRCTAANKEWSGYAINEKVAVVLDENGESGYILGATWNDKDTPPAWATAETYGVAFDDGTTIKYDTETHELYVDCSKSIAAKVTVKAPLVEVQGNLTVTGVLAAGQLSIAPNATSGADGTSTLQGSIDVEGNIIATGGYIEVDGNITTASDVISGSISLKTHTHTSAGNGSPTSPPI